MYWYSTLRPTSPTIRSGVVLLGGQVTQVALFTLSHDHLQAVIDAADVVVGHNIIGFDGPVLSRALGCDRSRSSKVRDTLVMSRLLEPTAGGWSQSTCVG
jgi:hypothetical protein